MQDAPSPRLAPLRHRKRGERPDPDSPAPPRLVSGPPPCRLPQTLQKYLSACWCKQKLQECFLLVLWVFLRTCEWYFFRLIFFFDAMVCITLTSVTQRHSPIFKPDSCGNGQEVKKRCFSSFTLTISIVIL